MRISTGTLVTACALAAALAVAGCGGDSGTATLPRGEVFLQPVADHGPDPFTDSTATSPAAPAPVTRTPQPAQSGATELAIALRSLSGGTPGLYGGTRQTGSCDVQRQIDHLTADPARGRAFARAASVSEASVPDYLRRLTSVVLRADTRVTNHGYRDGRVTGFQSVLQAGTAVLVDNHGVPRVRCACGNPLTPPVAQHGAADLNGRAWSGYQPGQVIVVAPTLHVVTSITIIDSADHAWIERPLGHHGHDHDHVVAPPRPLTPTPVPSPHDSASSAPPSKDGASPSGESASPSGKATSPDGSPTDCATPTVTVTPGATDDTVTGPASDAPSRTPSKAPSGTPRTETSPGTPTVTPSERPSRTPAETPPARPTDCPTATADSAAVFGSPTDVFDS